MSKTSDAPCTDMLLLYSSIDKKLHNYNMRDEIAYHLPYFNGGTVEISETSTLPPLKYGRWYAISSRIS